MATPAAAEGGRKQYVLRSLHDPYYVFGSVDRLDSEYLVLQENSRSTVRSSVERERPQRGDQRIRRQGLRPWPGHHSRLSSQASSQYRKASGVTRPGFLASMASVPTATPVPEPGPRRPKLWLWSKGCWQWQCLHTASDPFLLGKQEAARI
ncbi:uncharacterized protein LOC112872671 [Panicum hallii]|uniref:uncharacterized protein LOC112872671 n=1 Tax=Panicum hallii TaxID=206008 RepID=UPI000DF4DC22|nr:uncharacterized protein LOC112872671 [Panicum hallii]